MKIVSAYSSAITPAMLSVAVAQSGVRWAVSRAQWVSLQYMAYMQVAITWKDAVTVEVKEEERKALLEAFERARPDTMLGLPLVVDDTLPPSFLELRRDDEVLCRIESLAIPCGMDTDDTPAS